MKKLKDTTVIFIIVALIASIVRFIYFDEISSSPLRNYHLLKGCDMRKLLHNGLVFGNSGIFSLYSLLIYVFQKPIVIIFVQLSLGVITSLLITYIALKSYGNKIIALIAGFIFAVYAPSLIYEGFLLKESIFLFTATLSLASLFFFDKKHNPLFYFLEGIVLLLPFTIRFSGILWCAIAILYFFLYLYYQDFKFKLTLQNCKSFISRKTTILFLLGVLSTIIFVGSFNYSRGGNYNPLITNYSYVLDIGAVKNAKSVNSEPTVLKSATYAKKDTFLEIYALKLFRVYNVFHAPNNINYNYIYSLAFSKIILLSPLLLAPTVLLGILLIMINYFRKRSKKIFFDQKNSFILILFLISFTIPLCVFLPLGRYKIILLPASIPIATYAILTVFQFLKKKKYLYLILTISAYFLLFYFLKPNTTPERDMDYRLHAIAITNIKQGDKNAIPYALKAYQLKASLRNLTYLSNLLMSNGYFKEANDCLLSQYDKYSNKFDYIMMLSSSCLGCGKVENAISILNNLQIPIDKTRKFNYFYQFGECYRMIKDKKTALNYYKKAEEYISTKNQKNLLYTGFKKL